MSNMNKHLKKTNPYCVSIFPKYTERYELMKREILLSSECITRKMTKEELDRLNNLQLKS